MLTPDQALSAYVSMDGPRSLPKLREQLMGEGLKVPSLGWFKKWSSRDEWVCRAQEHDRLVAARASEMSVEAEASERVSTATKFGQVASAALDIVIAGLETVQVTSLADIEQAQGIACRASAEEREISKGKNPASAISGMAEELEKSEGQQEQVWAAQLREITGDAPIN